MRLYMSPKEAEVLLRAILWFIRCGATLAEVEVIDKVSVRIVRCKELQGKKKTAIIKIAADKITD